MGRKKLVNIKHPIDTLEWVDPETLHANDYNPNKVFLPELELLALSIVEDGWTQPIVARPDGTIVDGFHRWTLSLRHEGVRRVSGNRCPVVRLRADATREDLMIATVRHNRARGQHGILKMSEIVRELSAKLPSDVIEKRLGMEDEERERLEDMRGSPERAGKDSFGKGWVPVDKVSSDGTRA